MYIGGLYNNLVDFKTPHLPTFMTQTCLKLINKHSSSTFIVLSNVEGRRVDFKWRQDDLEAPFPQPTTTFHLPMK
jgi:hypothetical protein